MTPGQWQRIEAIFHAARERPEEERARFVEAACGSDGDVRREVESLLRQPVSADGPLDHPAVELAAPILATDASLLSSGRRLGAFELGSLLGVGGMGEVYRARDTRLGREVAIKILPRAFVSNPDRQARFEREARVLASLNHRHIAAIYGFEDADGLRGLVLELVEGQTLAEYLTDGGSRRLLPLGETLDLARQIADALEAAHDKGIVHRDLKPANIKLTGDGVVKVLDFGLAKITSLDEQTDVLHGGQDAGATREGALVGTVAYMSPEQARGLQVDRRTDIWAFGCILYEMLCGTPAFSGATLADTLAAILERDPDWSLIPSAAPPGVRHLLRRCLQKEPKSRLRDIGDGRLDLEEAIGLSTARTTRSFPRPRSTVIAGGAVAAALFFVGGGLVGTRLARAPAPANPLSEAAFRWITIDGSDERDAVLTPTGDFVAYLSNRGGQQYNAWVLRTSGEGDPANVTNGRLRYIFNTAIRNLAFAADGSTLAIGDEPRDDQGQVATDGRGYFRTDTFVMPWTGGEGTMTSLLRGGVEVAWSPDRTKMAYHLSGQGDPIFVADANGRDPEPIFPPKDRLAEFSKSHSHYLTWSPDGRWVYFAHGTPPARMDIWRVRVEDGFFERITHHDSDVAYPTFIYDRTLVYRALGEDGSGPWLYHVNPDRPRPVRVTIGPAQILSVSAAANGRRLVVTSPNPISGIYALPMPDADATVAEESIERIPAGHASPLSPRYGADGSLWYTDAAGGIRGLWRRTPDGTVLNLWKASEGSLVAPPAISGDGRFVAFVVRRREQTILYRMNADGSELRRLSETLDIRDAPTWSPDNRWLAVTSQKRLFRLPAGGGGEPTPLADNASLPVWSPKDDFILYSDTSPGGPTFPVKAVTPDGQPYALPEFSVRRSHDRYHVLPDGRRIVFVSGDYGRQDFWMADLDTKRIRRLTTLRPGQSIEGFDVSGERILFDRVNENADIMVIDLPQGAPREP